ncbi:MAG TPA: hypothetical protein VET23_01170 [Chitinophagaceae bacterium]|nr:hypothetical protein [Chitinophagaceae bacterium]
MNRFFPIIIFLFASFAAKAQKDTLRSGKVLTKQEAPKVTLTIQQEQWLKNNYSRAANLSKEQARVEIKKSLPGISEASMEYIINQSEKLLQQDKQKQIAILAQMLQVLRSQKNLLEKKIKEKEDELNNSSNADLRNTIIKEIERLKTQLAEVNLSIKQKEDKIRQVK